MLKKVYPEVSKELDNLAKELVLSLPAEELIGFIARIDDYMGECAFSERVRELLESPECVEEDDG